jgi:hypothetical protein
VFGYKGANFLNLSPVPIMLPKLSSITNFQGGFMVTEEHGECRAPLQFQEALAMHTSSSG